MVAIITGQDNGLIHQYKFDGDLKDAVGDQHGKVLKGKGTTPIFIKDRDGNENGAISFPVPPGDWYCVEVGTWSPSKLGTENEMTVTFWALWRGSNDNLPQDIINKRDNYSGGKMVWGINQHGFTKHVLSVQRKGAPYANSTKGIPQDKWTHVAVSMDNKNAYFYMDGELYDTKKYSFGNTYNAMIRIGNSANDGKANVRDNFNGALDDVCFFSRKLTDEEIKNIFKPATSISRTGTYKYKTRVKIFHNYSDNSIQIKNIAGKATFLVVDLRGKLLIKKEVNSSTVIFSKDKLSPGINIVKIMNTGENIEGLKILK